MARFTIVNARCDQATCSVGIGLGDPFCDTIGQSDAVGNRLPALNNDLLHFGVGYARRKYAAVSPREFGGAGVSDVVIEFVVREMNSNERTDRAQLNW